MGDFISVPKEFISKLRLYTLPYSSHFCFFSVRVLPDETLAFYKNNITHACVSFSACSTTYTLLTKNTVTTLGNENLFNLLKSISDMSVMPTIHKRDMCCFKSPSPHHTTKKKITSTTKKKPVFLFFIFHVFSQASVCYHGYFNR